MASSGRAKSIGAGTGRKDKAREDTVAERQVQALHTIQEQLLEIAARLAFVAATAGTAAKQK